MKYFLNLALLFITFNAAAQSNYQNGFIVDKKTNDTVRGFIEYKNPAYTFQTILFKRTKETKEAILCTPADIKAFYIAPFYSYISYEGRVSDNDKEVQLFLEQRLKGNNATLYFNKDDKKTRYFLKEKNASPVELTAAGFTGQLKEVYYKYNTGNNKKLLALESTEFTLASLEDALHIINDDVPEKEYTEATYQFYAGASVAAVFSKAYNVLGRINDIKSTNISPRISVGVSLMHDPNVQKFILRGELSFSYLKPSYSFSYSPNGVNTIDNNTYRYTAFSMAFTPQVIYNIYNSNSFKLFIGAGMAFNLSIYQTNETDYYTITSFAPYTLTPATDYSIKYPPFLVNIPFQAGVQLNHNIEAAVNYSPRLTMGSQTNPKFQSVGVALRYIFK
ncbi:hypothetical protein [Mucilaginibacter sp.]|uniref:outer membrane beta-barrel protein n=1 Tax=Mucilaginibacter sp. TaxID=1882438 RepID=UPI0026329326|nr:hypothetical protein [Mucilaginibacter sp.]MDB5029286.1 hypothetical protein [Mucilaginibacter sp.]